MATGEQLHRMTENVYRHTIEGFNPELRNLVTLGRAYEKALQSVSQAAKDYFNAIVAVGELASETKDSRQLGQSLLQIAETYRQIETEREITVHALRKELLHPLEGKLEQEWKSILQVQKTYLSENKAKSEAVEKCRTEVKKLQKKTQKNHSEKYIEKEQRTAEELQLLTKQLHNFRSNGLREAWSEERRRYCYLVDRYCSLIKNNAAFFSKAQSVLHHRLPRWNESCDKPDKLPEECEDILSFDFSGPLETPLQVELRNSRRLYERNILLTQNEERIKKSPQHEPHSPKPSSDSDRPLSVDVEPQQQPPPPSSTGMTSSYSATLPNIKKLGSSTHPSVHQLPPFQQTTSSQQQMIPPMTQAKPPSPPQQHQPSQQPQPHTPSGLAGRQSKSLKSPHHLHAISQTMPRQSFMRRVSEGGDMMENDQKMPRVQAVYTHAASGENQLAFSEGDIIGLVGLKNNGWFYGHNCRSRRNGWFPITYTQPLAEGDIIGLVGPKNNGWFYGHNYRSRRNGWFPITYTQPLAEISPNTNGTSNILNTKAVAASMDNLQSLGGDYPTPDYSGPGSPVSPMAPAASTLSLPQVGIAIPTNLSTAPTYTNPSTSSSNNNGMGNGGVKPSGLLMTAPLGFEEGDERHPLPNQHIQQQTGNSSFLTNTVVPTTFAQKQSASIQPDVQLSQIQLSVADENTNVPPANNGEEGENNPFTKIQLRKTVTNDRSAPIIPRDYQMGEYARH